MIEITNVKKSFGNINIFDNFSCTIEDGEMVVFSGVSGKGKTTLLNMIGGLEKYQGGQIIVDGLDASSSRNLKKLYKNHFGFLFQNFALIEKESVEKNLKLIDKKNRTKMTVSEALEKVGLKGYEKRKVYTLSGGEQQRVAIARLFLKKCSIILADEPTGSLDKKNADIIMDYLLDLNKEGKTVIIVTHDEEYKKKCERIVNL
ncbi:MAG: ATP-binding cassette domain-containing protein [Lachnospiraceae bacterium]|nr:ATP-binding cassette domain-containing protein [Lachnospiraceae bacterium]